MNWLELDKVRSGHTTRPRRKAPDPRIGDHLPPPTSKQASPTHSTDDQRGDSPASPSVGVTSLSVPTSSSPIAPQASPESPPQSVDLGGHRGLVGQYGAPSPSNNNNINPSNARAPQPCSVALNGRYTTGGAPSPQGGGAGLLNPSLNVTRYGGGRLSSVISDMQMMTSDHTGRVLSLKGAAAEASHAQGDSLDLLLQEFAGGPFRSSGPGSHHTAAQQNVGARVGEGVVLPTRYSPSTSPPLYWGGERDRYGELHSVPTGAAPRPPQYPHPPTTYAGGGYSSAVVDNAPHANYLLAPPLNTELSTTMVHTTEVVGPLRSSPFGVGRRGDVPSGRVRSSLSFEGGRADSQ